MYASLILYNRGSFFLCFKDYEQGYFSKISINIVSNLISFVHSSSGNGLFPPNTLTPLIEARLCSVVLVGLKLTM